MAVTKLRHWVMAWIIVAIFFTFAGVLGYVVTAALNAVGLEGWQ